MSSLVSVIIPVYNAEKFLKRCIDSVLNQSYSNIEIILVDDCSTDSSRLIMDYYAKHFKNIVAIYNEERLYPGGARNVGLDAANGNFIYFLDSDDFISPDAVATLVKEALSYNAPIVSANFQTVIGPLKFGKQGDSCVHLIDLKVNKENIDDCSGVVWNNLFSHSLIERVRFSERIFYEDNAFIYPVLTKADFLVSVEKSLYFYRRNLSSITIQSKLFPNEQILDVYDIISAMKDACKQLGTYDEYGEVISKIGDRIAAYPILECVLWTGISYQEKKKVLANLLNYLRITYGINDIGDIEFLMKRASSPKLRIKLELLSKLMKKLPEVDDFDNIETARMILKKRNQ